MGRPAMRGLDTSACMSESLLLIDFIVAAEVILRLNGRVIPVSISELSLSSVWELFFCGVNVHEP